VATAAQAAIATPTIVIVAVAVVLGTIIPRRQLVLFGWLQSEHSIGTEHPASPFLFQFPGAAWDGSVARRPLALA
jgi:hypothetical protein